MPKRIALILPLLLLLCSCEKNVEDRLNYKDIEKENSLTIVMPQDGYKLKYVERAEIKKDDPRPITLSEGENNIKIAYEDYKQLNLYIYQKSGFHLSLTLPDPSSRPLKIYYPTVIDTDSKGISFSNEEGKPYSGVRCILVCEQGRRSHKAVSNEQGLVSFSKNELKGAEYIRVYARNSKSYFIIYPSLFEQGKLDFKIGVWTN